LNNTIGENHKCFIGGSVKGENKEGIANLFSKGDLVPAGSLDGYLGYSFSNGKHPNHESARKELLSQINLYENTVMDDFKKEMTTIVKTHTSSDSLSKLRNVLLSKLNSLNTIDEFGPDLNYDVLNDDEKIRVAKERIKSEYDNFVKKEESIREDFRKQLLNLREDLGPEKYWQLLIYGFGGIHGVEFKRFTGIDSIVLSNSFTDEYFRGGKAGLGINYQIRNFTIGLTYSYNETNNFSLLSKKEYSWKSSITQNGQTLSEDKKISAYSGSYDKVVVNEMNIDFILNLKLDKKAKNHILINPYTRSQLLSRKSDLLPNSTNIGCGFYFFQQTGKFIGGFYTELTDINQNYEKAKPSIEQNLRPPLKRLTFGIVGKFAFASILNLF
jgi:opacity protein-like surface antigen